MKVLAVSFFVVVGLAGSFGAPETPSGPYAPRGWRPTGPAFELPSRTENKNIQGFGSPSENNPQNVNVDITEEEIQYTGDIGTTEATTPYLEYGAPAGPSSDIPEDFGTTVQPLIAQDEDDEDLSVQGLPGLEAAKEFRTLPGSNPGSQRLRNGNQRGRLQVPARQKTARLQQQSFVSQQANRQATNGGRALNRGTVTQGFISQQFGRFTAPVAAAFVPNNLRANQAFNQNAFNQRFTNQRQEALGNFGGPAAEYGSPPNQFGPPAQEYGPVSQPPQEGTDQELPEEEDDQEVDQPQAQAPGPEDEDTTEANEAEGDDANQVAVSNAVATGRYILHQQTGGRPQRLRNGKLRQADRLRYQNVQQISDPIYMYNQFGQLVRIF